MNRHSKALYLCGVAATTMMMPVNALAQASSAPAPQATTNANNDAEIVVTANKREENLNKVGMSVTALSAGTLADRRIISVQDIAAAIPGLKYAESGTGTPIYTLRGVGFNEESLGVYPSVSVYVDEVPLPFPVLTLHATYDLQRVEALKGPQGTLFGQNATGGAINYIAAKPTQDFHYGGDVSYGRFNQVDGNLFVSGPLGEGLTGRIAVTGMHRDGWQKSVTRPSDDNGAVKYFAGRASLAYDSSNFRVLATINAWQDKSEPEAGQLIAIRPQQPANVHADVLNYPFASENPRSADWSTGVNSPSSDRKFIQGSVRADLDLGEVAQLTSITSYLRFKQQLSTDKDGMSSLVADLNPSNAKIRSFNQELRLSNQGASVFRWVLGANFEKSHTHEDQTLLFGDGSSSNASTLFINTTGSIVDQKIRNIAAFANVQYDVTSALTLKAGGRYTDSRNRADLCGYANDDGQIAALFNILGNLVGTVPFTPISVGDCHVLNFQGVPGDRFDNTLHEHNFSWLAGADYRLNETSLFYGNISRGYKSGSYPTLSASSFSEYIPVRQESVTSYEVGYKGSFADRHVRFNAAGFYYDYKGKQVRGKIVDPVFDVLDTLLNVPKSRIYGAEAELTVNMGSGFTVGGSGTYLKSKILTDGGARFSGPTAYGNSCSTAAGAPTICDFTGDELPFTPEWSYALNLDWKHDLGGGGSIMAGADLRGQSSSVSTLHGRDIAFRDIAGADRHITSTDRPFVIPSYATIDARVGYQFAKGPKIMLWGKNIFNKYYITNVNHYLDATVRFAGMPATYGVTLSFTN